MKTPLQELMEWFNERPQYDKTSEGYEIMQKAQELLAKEKQNIINAYMDGHHIKDEFYNPEEYYKENFI